MTREEALEFAKALADARSDMPREDRDALFFYAGSLLFPADEAPAPSEREVALAEAAQEFIDKCDRGEAKSRASYSAFKAALAKGSGAANEDAELIAAVDVVLDQLDRAGFPFQEDVWPFHDEEPAYANSPVPTIGCLRRLKAARAALAKGGGDD